MSRGASSVISPKLLIVYFKGEFSTLGDVEFPFDQTYLNTVCLQWWKRKGEGDQTLFGKQRDCQHVCLCINIKHLMLFETPSLLFCLSVLVCMNVWIYISAKWVQLVSPTQYWLRWFRRHYLVVVAPLSLKQVQSPCVLLTHCHYWSMNHQLPVAKVSIALKIVA